MLSEAIANAVRHGGASNVDIVIKKAEGFFAVNVRDNGTGFDGPASTGTTSLHDRVCELGGSLTVSSSSSGAELAIRFPVS